MVTVNGPAGFMTLHWTACLLVVVYQVCCDVYSCFTFLYLLLMYEIYSILIQFVICWKSCTSVYLCEHDVLLSHNINHAFSFTAFLLSATAGRYCFAPLNGIHGSVTNMVCFWSMFPVTCMQYVCVCTSMHRPVHRGVHWVCTNPRI